MTGSRAPSSPKAEPAVSVVVPTRNRQALLARTLQQVLRQRDVRDVQVIVVDEGSSDGTAEYLRGLQMTSPSVEVVSHPEPRGLPAARNAGLERARAPWVAFCDDDDLWSPGKLAAQVATLSANPDAQWCCVGAVSIDLDERLLSAHRPLPPPDLVTELRRQNEVPGGGSGVLAASRLLRELGGFNESLKAAEDWDMWLRLSQRSPVCVVDRPLVGYRVAAGSMSHEATRMHASLSAFSGLWGDQTEHLRSRFLARQALTSGARRDAFRLFLASARETRQAQDVVGAVTALTAGSAYNQLRAWRIPAAYRREATQWLRE